MLNVFQHLLLQNTMDRETLAGILEEIGSLLELAGENPFKARAYYNAARLFRGGDLDPQELVEHGGLRDLPGIGDALVKKITELVQTGGLAYLDSLRASIPSGLIDIMRIPGIGPRRAHTIHKKLGIGTLDELAKVCVDGRLAALTGFDEGMAREIGEYIKKD